MATCHTYVHGTPEMAQADHYYVNRLVKTILWMKGGFRIYQAGDEDTYEYLKGAFAPGGDQDFDARLHGQHLRAPLRGAAGGQGP